MAFSIEAPDCLMHKIITRRKGGTVVTEYLINFFKALRRLEQDRPDWVSDGIAYDEGSLYVLVGMVFKHRTDYGFSADSIAEITCGESGVTAGSKRAIGCPLRAMRNFVKFHLISPLTLGAAVRYW